MLLVARNQSLLAYRTDDPEAEKQLEYILEQLQQLQDEAATSNSSEGGADNASTISDDEDDESVVGEAHHGF